MDLNETLSAIGLNLTCKCSDEEWARLCAESQKEIEHIKEQHEEEVRLARYRMTVPRRYWEESLQTYQTTPETEDAFRAACKYVSDVRAGKFRTLVLLGNPGTGKTHLACGILLALGGGTYRMSATICDEMQRARGFGSKVTELDILEKYSRDLCVVDEVGRALSEKEEKYMLYQIVNACNNNRTNLVIVSNFSRDDFLKYAGEAVIDRLTESASIVELSGASYRTKKRGE